MRQIFWGILVAVIGLACGKEQPAPDPYTVRREVGPFVYELRYLLHADTSVSGSISTPTKPTDTTKEPPYRRFLLSVRMANGQAVEKYLDQEYGPQGEGILNQLRFALQQDFQLQIGAQQLPCVLYHLETTPFKDRGLNFNLVFRDSATAGSLSDHSPIQFHFQDRILSGQAIHLTLTTPTPPALSFHTDKRANKL